MEFEPVDQVAPGDRGRLPVPGLEHRPLLAPVARQREDGPVGEVVLPRRRRGEGEAGPGEFGVQDPPGLAEEVAPGGREAEDGSAGFGGDRHSAAEPGLALEQHDLVAGPGEACGRREPGRAAADDRDQRLASQARNATRPLRIWASRRTARVIVAISRTAAMIAACTG